VRDDEILVERLGKLHEAGPFDPGLPAEAQVVAALAEYLVSHERA
jgi:hypothetical protein